MKPEARFRIETATADDLRAAAEVHSKAVGAAYPEVLPPEIFDPEYVAPEKMEKEFRSLFDSFGPRDALLKAVADHRVIGICVCGDDTEQGDKAAGYLQRIYVDPDWWNRGVASALVDRALELLADHGFRVAALQVLENNKKSSYFLREAWLAIRAVGRGEERWDRASIHEAIDQS